jgi:hypothetical protein
MKDMPEANERLKQAVRGVEAPEYLKTRLQAHLRTMEHPRRWRLNLAWAAVGALAVLCLALGLAYQSGYLRLSPGSREAYIASVSNKVPTLMRVGLGDHVHCSVFRKFPKDAPKVADLEKKLNAEYRPLIQVVQSNVPADYHLMIVHECRYHGRKFVHLSLKNDSHLLSLVIARKSEGESFGIEGVLPELVSSGIPIYRAGVQRFEMAAIESRDYLVYFISDLPGQRNTEMMTAMAPQVNEFLRKLEAI